METVNVVPGLLHVETVFFAQLADDAGVGAWPIGMSGAITFYIAALAYLKWGYARLKAADGQASLCAGSPGKY